MVEPGYPRFPLPCLAFFALSYSSKFRYSCPMVNIAFGFGSKYSSVVFESAFSLFYSLPLVLFLSRHRFPPQQVLVRFVPPKVTSWSFFVPFAYLFFPRPPSLCSSRFSHRIPHCFTLLLCEHRPIFTQLPFPACTAPFGSLRASPELCFLCSLIGRGSRAGVDFVQRRLFVGTCRDSFFFRSRCTELVPSCSAERLFWAVG